jgi:hypothetical protein
MKAPILSFLLSSDCEREEILVEFLEMLSLRVLLAESRSSKTLRDSIPSVLDFFFFQLVQVPSMLLRTEQQQNICHIQIVCGSLDSLPRLVIRQWILQQLAKPYVYTRNYWVFGLCPSSNILETRKQNVSETGSISVLMRGGTHLLS